MPSRTRNVPTRAPSAPSGRSPEGAPTGEHSVPLVPRWAPWAVGLAAAPLATAALLPAAASIGAFLPIAAVDLAASFTRMLLAYLLSLGFAITYGYYAATNRPAERVMIPVLDILQSVPILGFFPIALVVIVAAIPNPIIGPNLASIFLIFTSMSWNMVFGVYESIKSIPQELREATDSFGVRGAQRLRQVLVPATINRLVYNSILSWTGGWYFLVAAEIISVSRNSTVLPGIGSFLLAAAATNNVSALLAGLILLIVLITLMDVFVWRPLTRYAERFRYDTAPSGVGEGSVVRRPAGTQQFRRAAGTVVRYVRTGVTRVSTPFIALRTSVVARTRRGRDTEFARSAIHYVALGTILVVVWLMLIAIGVAVYGIFRGPITHRYLIGQLPLALVYSLGRVSAAYTLSVLIALPLAIWVTSRRAARRFGMPVIEVVASVPATALFPLFIFALLPYLGFNGVAIVMLVTGMLWYLFFNLLSGLRAVPPDLEEAARSYGFTRRQLYRRLILPAIFPAFITGSITAFGGGWNTLIIAEYIHYSATQQFHVVGLGELLNLGVNAQNGTGLPLMVAALLVLVIAVVVLNELLWKPLYRRAVERYRID